LISPNFRAVPQPARPCANVLASLTDLCSAQKE
jgi:hypothetical protein